MLRFEKISRSKSLGIALRSKNPFWTEELILAGGIALFFHLAMGFLFSISSLHWATPSLMPSVQVSAERLTRPLDLNLIDSLKQHLSQPPKLTPSLLPLEAEFPISLEGPRKFTSKGYIRGPYPQELTLPVIATPILEHARLALRSDPQGRIFWFNWLEKTSQESLNRTLEAWLKTLSLLPENAFQTLLLEIQLVPND